MDKQHNIYRKGQNFGGIDRINPQNQTALPGQGNTGTKPGMPTPKDGENSGNSAPSGSDAPADDTGNGRYYTAVPAGADVAGRPGVENFSRQGGAYFNSQLSGTHRNRAAETPGGQNWTAQNHGAFYPEHTAGNFASGELNKNSGGILNGTADFPHGQSSLSLKGKTPQEMELYLLSGENDI